MLARSLTAILLAATAVSAWPIEFYPTNDCSYEPVYVLYEPPSPGKCGFFHDPVNSYSGGTADSIQKVLLYYSRELCYDDAAHRIYANHTINNSRNTCIPFKKENETPKAFTFIEEILPVPPSKNTSSTASCNALRVQTWCVPICSCSLALTRITESNGMSLVLSW